MPPQIRPTRTVGGETREWDGSAWVPVGGGDGSPQAPMLSVPSATFTPEQQAANRDQGNWLLKNLLMTGGMVAGGALTGGVAPMILGAAGGRMLARVPEVALEHTMGRGKSFGDEAEGFLDEGATGAMEGLEGELGARAAGPALKFGGRGLQALGKSLGDVGGREFRGGAGVSRAYLAHLFGLGPAGSIAAAVGPPIATELGKRAERAGVAMGGEGLAEGLGGAYEALKKRLWPESAERAIVPTGNPRTTWSPTSETPYRMGGSTSYETAGRKFPGPDATPPLDILATPTSGTGVAEGTASAQTPQAQEWFSGARKGSIEPDYPARPPIRVQSSPSTDALLERADPGAAVTRTRPTASETVDAASRDASGTGFLETPRWVGDVGVEIRDAFNKLNEKLKKNWW